MLTLPNRACAAVWRPVVRRSEGPLARSQAYAPGGAPRSPTTCAGRPRPAEGPVPAVSSAPRARVEGAGSSSGDLGATNHAASPATSSMAVPRVVTRAPAGKRLEGGKAVALLDRGVGDRRGLAQQWGDGTVGHVTGQHDAPARRRAGEGLFDPGVAPAGCRHDEGESGWREARRSKAATRSATPFLGSRVPDERM